MSFFFFTLYWPTTTTSICTINEKVSGLCWAFFCENVFTVDLKYFAQTCTRSYQTGLKKKKNVLSRPEIILLRGSIKTTYFLFNSEKLCHVVFYLYKVFRTHGRRRDEISLV